MAPSAKPASPSKLGAPSRAVLALGPILALALALTAVPALAAPSQFGTKGSGAGQFEEPRGVAVNQETGDLYIADRNNNRIDQFGSEGNFIRAWGWGVADGTTAAPQTCTVNCFGGFGAPFEGSGPGQFSSAEGIAVDNDPTSASRGDVYVVDLGNHRVQKFSSTGEFLLMFGGEVDKTTTADVCTKADLEGGDECGAGVPGGGPGQFEGLTGRSIAVGSTGTVYVGDEGRVQLFSPAGLPESEIALSGAGLVENLAIDSAGDIYVKSSGLAGVRKYDPSGTELGSPRAEAGAPENDALAIGPGDELFVNGFLTGEGSHHLLGFAPSGEQTSSFDSASSEAQDGRRGIAYSKGLGALYVLNPDVVRIVAPPPPGPLVLPGSETATEIGTTSATLNATINPEGGEEAKYSFEYGTSTAYGETAPAVPVEISGGPFEDQPASVPIESLQPRTTYHFRARVTNKAGETSLGPDQSFETLPPVSIDSTSVSAVTATSATLETELNPHGLPSHYHFEYDTAPYAEGEAAHGTVVPFPDASAGESDEDVPRTTLVQGLEAATTYYLRVVAENELGKVEGPGRSFTTQGAAAVLLPDGRAWELVSPPNKHGAPLEPITEEGGVIEAAADGNGITYVASAPVEARPAGNRSPEMSQQLSRRAAGWSSEEITTPHEEISGPGVGHPAEYLAFSEDLASALVEPLGATPLSPQTSERTPYLRTESGEFVPLVNEANVPSGTEFGGEESPPGSGSYVNGIQASLGSADLGHVLLESRQVLAAGFSPSYAPSNESPVSIYEYAGGTLQLISILPDDEPTAEAGLQVGIGNEGSGNLRGAISEDGNRVIFTIANGPQAGLYLRDAALGETLHLDVPQAGAAGGAPQASFQAASADGSKVFFTDTARLTPDSTASPSAGKPDLYMCEVEESGGDLACDLSDLSVAINPGEKANVFPGGMLSAAASDGSRVYFSADGVLTEAPNEAGEEAAPADCAGGAGATCNLYSYDTGTDEVSLVAVLSSQDSPDWGREGLRSLTARVSLDGRRFAFMSQRSLTGYDNRDLASGQRDEEVFLYDAATGALRCASCDPSGARPHGVFETPTYHALLVDYPHTWPERWLAASIPGWTAKDLTTSLYQSRYLSNSGRLFFTAADPLVPQDTNGVMDVYQYEPAGVGDCSEPLSTFSARSGGCVSLISAGTSPEESAFLDASQSGDDVFFLTASRLTAKDVDAAPDVYDARVGGAEAEAARPVECAGDACQAPATPPSDLTPGTLTLNGAGNVKQCSKGRARRHGRCVRKHHAKKHKRKHHQKRRRVAGNKRGTGR